MKKQNLITAVVTLMAILTIATQSECFQIQILIPRTREAYFVNVEETDTIKDVKNKIKEQYPQINYDFRLVFAGKRFPNENATLADYEIVTGDDPIHLINIPTSK